MIPAILIGRKGSKGFPGKNTFKVLGQPLCYYPTEAAKKTKLIDQIYYSTDCPLLKEFAISNKYKVIDRAEYLAQCDS